MPQSRESRNRPVDRGSRQPIRDLRQRVRVQSSSLGPWLRFICMRGRTGRKPAFGWYCRRWVEAFVENLELHLPVMQLSASATVRRRESPTIELASRESHSTSNPTRSSVSSAQRRWQEHGLDPRQLLPLSPSGRILFDGDRRVDLETDAFRAVIGHVRKQISIWCYYPREPHVCSPVGGSTEPKSEVEVVEQALSRVGLSELRTGGATS